MGTIEVMRKALEALEPRCGTNADERGPDGAITALRAEIERLEAVEPVARGMVNAETGLILDVICPEEHAREPGSYTVPLYTAPQPAERMPLTEAISLYEAALLESWPQGAKGKAFDNWNAARRLLASIRAAGVKEPGNAELSGPKGLQRSGHES